jgi:hypothetical protein
MRRTWALRRDCETPPKGGERPAALTPQRGSPTWPVRKELRRAAVSTSFVAYVRVWDLLVRAKHLFVATIRLNDKRAMRGSLSLFASPGIKLRINLPVAEKCLCHAGFLLHAGQSANPWLKPRERFLRWKLPHAARIFIGKQAGTDLP